MTCPRCAGRRWAMGDYVVDVERDEVDHYGFLVRRARQIMVNASGKAQARRLARDTAIIQGWTNIKVGRAHPDGNHGGGDDG